MKRESVLYGVWLWTLLILSSCGGPVGSNDNDNGSANDPVAACERFLDYFETVPCRNPDLPRGSCLGVDLVPPEQLRDYDCLIGKLSCTADGMIDDSRTAECE